MSGRSVVSNLAVSAGASERQRAPGAAPAVETPPDPERVRALAAMLPEKPTGVGRPLSDRPAWAELAGRAAFREVIPRAEKLLAEPLPEQPDDLFLDFSRTGNRRRWERVAFQRRSRVSALALAECLEPSPASVGYQARDAG